MRPTQRSLDSTQAQLDRSSYVRAFWVLSFGLLAILFNAYRSRLYRELEEERTIYRDPAARVSQRVGAVAALRGRDGLRLGERATWRSAATCSTSTAFRTRAPSS